MVDLRPDIAAAVLAYTKDSADLTQANMAGSNIFLEWPTKNDVLTIPTSPDNFLNVILIESKRGGAGDIGGGLFESRVIYKVYGKNKLQASNMWGALDYYLMKPDGRTQTSFTRASTNVKVITQEGGPQELYDPDASGWPYIVQAYLFLYSGVKVS